MFKVHRNKLTQQYSNKQQSESESKQNWHEWKKKNKSDLSKNYEPCVFGC